MGVLTAFSVGFKFEVMEAPSLPLVGQPIISVVLPPSGAGDWGWLLDALIPLLSVLLGALIAHRSSRQAEANRDERARKDRLHRNLALGAKEELDSVRSARSQLNALQGSVNERVLSSILALYTVAQDPSSSREHFRALDHEVRFFRIQTTTKSAFVKASLPSEYESAWSGYLDKLRAFLEEFQRQISKAADASGVYKKSDLDGLETELRALLEVFKEFDTALSSSITSRMALLKSSPSHLGRTSPDKDTSL